MFFYRLQFNEYVDITYIYIVTIVSLTQPGSESFIYGVLSSSYTALDFPEFELCCYQHFSCPHGFSNNNFILVHISLTTSAHICTFYSCFSTARKHTVHDQVRKPHQDHRLRPRQKVRTNAEAPGNIANFSLILVAMKW